MGLAVVTVASGGLPVVDVTATTPGLGVPVTEAANGLGIPVTKVTLPKGGLPVTYVAATLFRDVPSITERLTVEEGLARGFHPTYDVLAQGEWKWTGNGWEK